MIKILYFIQLPPPHHGVSIINDFVWNNEVINKDFDKKLLPLSFSSEMKTLGTVSLDKFGRLFYLMRQLRKNISSFKPDYIYFSIAPTGKAFIRDLFFVFIIKTARVTPVYHIHGKGIYAEIRSSLKKKIYQWVFSNSKIIHLSEGLLNSEIRPLSVKNADLYFAENGVLDFHDVKPDKDAEKRKVVYIGVLSESKGIKLLLNIAKEIKDSNNDVVFDLIGTFANDQMQEYILRFIEDNDLQETVILHGYKDGVDKWNIITNGDILLHPTLNDAFPVVLLEAMSCGLPIVSTNMGAIPEMVEVEGNALICEAGDENALYNNLKRLLDDEILKEKMSRRSRELYLDKYAGTAFESRMRNIFEKL